MNTPSLGLLRALAALLLGLVLCCRLRERRAAAADASDARRHFPVLRASRQESATRRRQCLCLPDGQAAEQSPLRRSDFRHFFGEGGNSRPGGPIARSLGSGVLVDASGLVVTNYHVIEGMTDVKIALADKREFDAEIVLRDQRTDLVVLRLKGGENFPVMELGNSDALEVGDIVLAIGDPFGVGQTVTQGIVSALARTQAGISDYGFFIQTDAAINPGNSGGGLDRHAGKARRHQFRDLFANRKFDRDRFRDPGQYGENRDRRRQGRRTSGAAPLARREPADRVEGNRRFAWPRPAVGRACRRSLHRRSGRQRRVYGAAISSPPSTVRASTIPRASATGWPRNRSAAPRPLPSFVTANRSMPRSN